MLKLKQVDVHNIKQYPNELMSLKTSQDRYCGFMLCDLGEVVKRYQNWCYQLPRVKPYYAIKACDDPAILSTLASLGTGFDSASKNEVKMVLDLDVSPDRIIYDNTCKPVASIKYAAENNVQMMAFDDENELRKIHKEFPQAKLVMRLLPNVPLSRRLSNKFGVHSSDTQKLLECAKDLGVNLVGISFHIGLRLLFKNANAFSATLAEARKHFDAARKLGMDLELLNIGGGFPDKDIHDFNMICRDLRQTLDRYFPEDMGIKIIAEPGRYFVNRAFSLASYVGSKRLPSEYLKVDKDIKFWYYLSDSLLSALNNLRLFPDLVPQPTVLQRKKKQGPVYSSRIWGPSLYFEDCIYEKIDLPELDVGDWLLFTDMGAYNSVLSTRFNGIDVAEVYYVIQKNYWNMFSCARNNVTKERITENDGDSEYEEWIELQLQEPKPDSS